MPLKIEEALEAVTRAKAALDALATSATTAIKAGQLNASDPIVNQIAALNPQLIQLQVRAQELKAAQDVITGPSYSFSSDDVYKSAVQLQGQCFQLGAILAAKTGQPNPVTDPKLGTPPGFFAGLGGVLSSTTSLVALAIGGVALYLVLRK